MKILDRQKDHSNDSWESNYAENLHIFDSSESNYSESQHSFPVIWALVTIEVAVRRQSRKYPKQQKVIGSLKKITIKYKNSLLITPIYINWLLIILCLIFSRLK